MLRVGGWGSFSSLLMVIVFIFSGYGVAWFSIYTCNTDVSTFRSFLKTLVPY